MTIDSVSSKQAKAVAGATRSWEVEVFFDGNCPLCAREIEMLRKKDRQKRIRFTNFVEPSFETTTTGRTFEQLMAQIHGRLPDGQMISGVEVFRRLYSAVGFGHIVFLTRIPPLSWGLDLIYLLFARNRLRITGRHRLGRNSAGECSFDSCSQSDV